MNRRHRRVLILLILGAAWLLAPQMAYADNCSSLNDCYYTLRAALAAAVGLGIFAALMAIGLDIGPLTRGLKSRFNGGAGGEGAAGSEGSEPDVWDQSLGVVSVGGMVAEQPRTAGARQAQAPRQSEPPGAAAQRGPKQVGSQAGEQAKAAPGKEARLPEQTAPEGETAAEQARMRQAAPEESARRGPEQAAGERTPDQARGETAAGDLEHAGRSGEWAGERGAAEPGAADTGDVVDRAGEVADAFDAPEAEGMAQAERPQEMTGEASTQAVPDQEASSQSRPPQEGAPSEVAQERAKPAGLQADSEAQASTQNTPPSDATTAEAGDFTPDSGAARTAGAAAPANAEVARTLLGAFGELAAVPGARLLLQRAAVSGRWAVSGSAAELGIAQALGRQGTTTERLGDVVEGRAGADIVVREGAVIQVKNYYWDGPHFFGDDSIAGATRRVVRQVELLRRRYPGREVSVAFSDLRGTPRQMGVVLQSVGVKLVRLGAATPPRAEDVVDARFVERLRGLTADTVWRVAVAAGWDAADRSLATRLAACYERDGGSAWLAFAVCAFDAESIYETNPLGESYTAHLRLLSERSEGAFAPENVSERVVDETLEVAFESGGQRYVSRVSAQSDWFDFRVLHAVNAAMAASGEQRRFTPLPAPDQIIYLAFMSEESRRTLQEAGLVPAVWPMDRPI